MHCAGPQASDTEALVGSLFDIDIDAPDWLPSTVADFLASRSWSSDDLQLTVTLPPSTSVTLAGSSVKFSKPVLVQKRMRRIDIDAELHGVTVSQDGRQYQLDLRGTGRIGVPDLTINLR
jgi:hypothetical protein